jgi:cobalamin biosynthesis protein CobD/CbiB
MVIVLVIVMILVMVIVMILVMVFEMVIVMVFEMVIVMVLVMVAILKNREEKIPKPHTRDVIEKPRMYLSKVQQVPTQ